MKRVEKRNTKRRNRGRLLNITDYRPIICIPTSSMVNRKRDEQHIKRDDYFCLIHESDK